MAGSKHGIDADLGARTVRAASRDGDVEERAAGHHRPRPDGEFPERQARRVVHAEHAVAGEALEQAVAEHRLGAAQSLLGRLEDEMHGAVEVARRGEVARRAQQHGGVPVVAAGVHLAGVARLVGQVGGLLDRQRVHVGAQADGRAVAGLQHPDHSRLADVAMHGAAEFGELAGDELGGAVLLEAELGMRMQVLPPRRHLVVKRAYAIQNLHARGLRSWRELGKGGDRRNSSLARRRRATRRNSSASQAQQWVPETALDGDLEAQRVGLALARRHEA